MSIKGIGNDWYVGKQKSTLISSWGKRIDFNYEDLDSITYFYPEGVKPGIVSFNQKSHSAIEFKFKQKAADPVYRAIKLIKENNTDLPINDIKDIANSESFENTKSPKKYTEFPSSFAKRGGNTKICKYCRTEIPYNAKICPQCRKKQGGALKWVIIGFVVVCVIGAAASGNDSNSNPSDKPENNNNLSSQAQINNDNTNIEIEEIVQAEETDGDSEITIDEIKDQAQELNYKDVMRNPDDYTGQYFYTTVKIFTAESGSLFSDYERAYKSFTNDENDWWMGDMIYLLDNRDSESSDYVKILEDDIVLVYGRFDSLVETKNALNGTKGEEMSLQLLYAELISE